MVASRSMAVIRKTTSNSRATCVIWANSPIGAAVDPLENKRQGSMYAYHTAPDDGAAEAHNDWQEIRAWALS